MTPTVGRLRWMFQKYRHLIDAFVLRRGPDFVVRRTPDPPREAVPVFTFHAVLPEIFEEQCKFLVHNGYRTLSGEEFRERLEVGEPGGEPAVLLTFDDGLKHVWTIAYPLLRKYGLRATCFLVPGCIPADDERVRPNLEDVWAGRAVEREVVALPDSEPPLATWAEIRRMQASGVVDFHSHTMYHALVPVTDRLYDFVGPRYDPYIFGNIHIPLYTRDGADAVDREPSPGLPIFRAAPRMQAERRFYPDEDLLARCVETVAVEGGADFFDRPKWRRRLEGVVEDFEAERGSLGRFESRSERDAAVRQELEASRREIERRLPGAPVRQLSFPWFDAKPFAMEAARDTGFEVTYFGHRGPEPAGLGAGRPSAVARLDELYLMRLPGEGRHSVSTLFRRLLQLRSMPGRLFPERSRDTGAAPV